MLNKRIKDARLARGISQVDLAKELGLSSQAVSLWESGAVVPKRDRILAMATLFGCSAAWLQYGVDTKDHAVTNEPREDLIDIDRYAVSFLAGTQMAQFNIVEKNPISFKASWLEKKNIKREAARCLYVQGDSMHPYLNDGDLILVDTNDKTIIDGEVFALRYGDELRVKRLSKRYDGAITISSDNPAFKEEVVAGDSLKHVELIGRVRWRAG
jgi:phage repressor protein C with HTH and peptisase S24 domain